MVEGPRRHTSVQENQRGVQEAEEGAGHDVGGCLVCGVW